MEIDLAELDGLAAGVLETGMAPAVAVALTTPEATLTTRTYGAASPVAPWPIASIGESFSAVIALQLADEGLLDLRAPVTDYVPWLSLRDGGLIAGTEWLNGSDRLPLTPLDGDRFRVGEPDW